MDKFQGRSDIKNDPNLDIVFSKNNAGYSEIISTKYLGDYGLIAQSIYNALSSNKNEWVNYKNFGVNISKFLGRKVSKALVNEVEKQILINLKTSGLYLDNLSISSKAALVGPDQIVIRIKVTDSLERQPLVIDMLYSTSDNRLTQFVAPVSS